MRETLIILLFVVIVAAIGMTTIDEYDFPTGNTLYRCATDQECGVEGWCENVDGGDGGIDGRRGHQCRAKFHSGVACASDTHCKSGYCDPKRKICRQPQYD